MASFSLAALTVLELAPPEMIELAARCGYEKVGLRLLPATPGGIAYRLMDDAPLMRETLARLQATGWRPTIGFEAGAVRALAGWQGSLSSGAL